MCWAVGELVGGTLYDVIEIQIVAKQRPANPRSTRFILPWNPDISRPLIQFLKHNLLFYGLQLRGRLISSENRKRYIAQQMFCNILTTSFTSQVRLVPPLLSSNGK